jgi:hypothetical protein
MIEHKITAAAINVSDRVAIYTAISCDLVDRPEIDQQFAASNITKQFLAESWSINYCLLFKEFVNG